MQVVSDAKFRSESFDREQRTHRIILPRLTRAKDASVQLHPNTVRMLLDAADVLGTDVDGLMEKC